MSEREQHERAEMVAQADQDAARLEGFCDCEALVVAMLTAMAAQELERVDREGAALLAARTPLAQEQHAREMLRREHRVTCLREVVLAVQVGQHRTDAYDLDELAKAHRRAANTPQQASNGGKAAAARMTPQERSERARKAGLKGGVARAAKRTPEQRKEQATAAATARWAKGEPE